MPATALQVDESTFRACIEKYTAELCLRWRIPRGEVDDVVQEVLTEILASLASFRADKGDFANWTRGIAWKVIRKHVRDSQRYAKRFAEYHPHIDEHPAPDASPERCARRKQVQCAISNAVENLSVQQIDVFVLHVVDDLTHGEIAEKLKITESNSQKCYQRARNQLAQCLRGTVLSAMPLDVIGCNESAPSIEGHSRWNERSHYAGQVVATILALLTFIPSIQASSMLASASGEIPTIASIKNDAMYRYDKQTDVQDEPVVLRDAPSVIPEPASLPSVRAVSAPTTVGDKPTYVQQPESLPPYKHTPRSFDHQQLGR